MFGATFPSFSGLVARFFFCIQHSLSLGNCFNQNLLPKWKYYYFLSVFFPFFGVHFKEILIKIGFSFSCICVKVIFLLSFISFVFFRFHIINVYLRFHSLFLFPKSNRNFMVEYNLSTLPTHIFLLSSICFCCAPTVIYQQ